MTSLTTEEKINAVIDSLRARMLDNDAKLPQWEGDAHFAELTDAIEKLLLQKEELHATALQEQQEFYEGLLDQLPTDFALVDDSHKYLYISAHAIPDAALRKWLIGKTDLDFCNLRDIDPAIAHQRWEKFEMAIKSGQPTEIMEVRQNREGITTHKLRIFVPITSPSGAKLVAGYSHDITDLAHKELSLIAKNEALEKANFELDQFVYRASHDLRAPLSSVQGLLQLTFATTDPQEAQHYLQLMERAILKMDGFIRDIVHHSKNARQELDIQHLDLQAAFDNTMEQLRFMAGADRVQVQFQVNAVAPLYSDAFRIGILLNNLISNGIKYQDPQKEAPQVWVNAQIEQHWVELVVRDNGIGIGQAHLVHVFEMFYRATHLATGTGIGLYIVQEVAKKLGGQAELVSELGVGTTFRVRFPNHLPG